MNFNNYARQINLYKDFHPLYVSLMNSMIDILNHVLKDNMLTREFFIQGRIKEISSFAEKFLRKKPDRLTEITDICGIRVILNNLEKKEQVCDLIRDTFIVEADNSEETTEGLGRENLNRDKTRFVVRLKPKKFYRLKFNIKILNQLTRFKAEIQVCTLMEHAWAVNKQSVLYKNEFKPPQAYKNELNKVSALLKLADHSMNEIIKKMHDYETSYGAYLSREEIELEIERLEYIYSLDNSNIDLGHKIAKLAMTTEEFDKAITLLSDIYNSSTFKELGKIQQALIVKDLGVSKIQFYNPERDRQLFEQGQKDLLTSISLNDKDSDSYASLGGSYKKLGMDVEAFEWYKKALKINPDDPYSLVNYLVYELLDSKNVDKIIDYHRELISRAIEKRSDQINVLVDIAWANFDVGLLTFFLKNIEASLHNFLMAIRLSQEKWMINTTLKTFNKLQVISDQFQDFRLIKTLLMLGIKFKKWEGSEDANPLIDLELKNNPALRLNPADLKEPILILAGGTDKSVEREMLNYRRNVIDAFEDFNGTIISGGTVSGLSRIAGDIKEKYKENVRLIGYSPRTLPLEGNIKLDERYDEHRFSKSNAFSYLEILQYWYDILRSGIDPSHVKLIGINGGKLSALEFRTAITFGAQVGIVENSGRSANDIITDPWWNKPIKRESKERPRILIKVIKNSPGAINDFLSSPFITDPDILNLRKLLIQNVNGNLVYTKDFSDIEVPDELISGMLSAIQSFSEEIGFGELPVLSSKQGTIILNNFNSGIYRVFIFLFEPPAPSLERKIIDFTKICEDELSEEFVNLHEIIAYTDHAKIAGILSKVFGPEILKLFP